MGKFLFNKTVWWNSSLVFLFGGLAFFGIINDTVLDPIGQLFCSTVAGNIFPNLVQRFIDFIEIRFLGKSPDKSVPPVSRDENSARNKQSSSMQIELGGSFYSFIGFLIFLALMGYFVFLIIHNRYNPEILIWVFFCYGALLYILWLQIKGMSQPGIKKNAAGSVMLFLLILSSLYFVAPATSKEFFPEPMEGKINIIVSNMGGTSQIIYEDLQMRVDKIQLQDIEFRLSRSLRNKEEAQTIATDNNAHIVIWWLKKAMGEYQPRFLVRGFDEGGGEIAGRFSTLVATEGDLELIMKKRAEIMTSFITGLIPLFYNEQSEAQKSIKEFDRTIKLMKEQQEGLGRDGIEDTVYFFKCRAHSVAGQHQEALDACQHTLDVNPDYAWAYMVRGTVYYSQAVELGPSDEHLQDLLNQALVEYDKALQVYTGIPTNLPPREAYVQAKTYVNIASVQKLFAQVHWEDDDNFNASIDAAQKALHCALYLYGEDFVPPQLCSGRPPSEEDKPVPGRYPARAYYGLGGIDQMEAIRLEKLKNEDAQPEYKEAQASYLRCQRVAAEDPDQQRASGILELCDKRLKEIAQLLDE